MSTEEVAKLQAANARTTGATQMGSFGLGNGGFSFALLIFPGLCRWSSA
jgi:hypothetical protein